jgi:hypothetical protein
MQFECNPKERARLHSIKTMKPLYFSTSTPIPDETIYLQNNKAKNVFELNDSVIMLLLWKF